MAKKWDMDSIGSTILKNEPSVLVSNPNGQGTTCKVVIVEFDSLTHLYVEKI